VRCQSCEKAVDWCTAPCKTWNRCESITQFWTHPSEGHL